MANVPETDYETKDSINEYHHQRCNEGSDPLGVVNRLSLTMSTATRRELRSPGLLRG